MSFSDISKNTIFGLNDRLQLFHFTWLGNAGFNDSQSGIFIKKPKRQRYTDLGIVALWAAGNDELVRKAMIQPFLYNGFAVASGNSKNFAVPLPAMITCHLLQGFQSIRNYYESSFRIRKRI